MPAAPPRAPQDVEIEAVGLLAHLDALDLERVIVAGEYVRFDPSTRNALKDFRGKARAGLTGASHAPTNLLVWGAPGSGKSFLVQEVARTLGVPVRLVEANLAALDAEGLRERLSEATSGSGDVVCLVDEVDAHPGEAWPYELLLPALEPGAPPAHRTVFCLVGSGGDSLAEFKDRIRARPKGRDLLSRVPHGNEFSIPSLGVGDKVCVAAIQILAAANQEGHRIREFEKFALFYLATSGGLQTARQLRAVAVSSARRIPRGEDRVRFDHLFDPGEDENKRFWNDHAVAREGLAGAFLAISPVHPAPPETSGPPGGGAPSPDPVPSIGPKTRIAILPFRNISPEASDSYFSEGLTEELIATVSKIGGLRVIARTSVMRFRDGSKSAAETARELRVGSLLEGSVRRAGDDLRVTAQLIDAATEEPVWSVRFDRRLENVFAIQEELARRIAESLHVQLMGREGATLGRTPTTDLEAYDLYLQGRQRFFQASEEGFRASIALFERAIARDPGFALAFCGLAEAQALAGNRGYVPLRPALERAQRSVEAAIRLDPDLGEAHAAQAPILYNRYDWAGAVRELDLAIALDPNNVQAHFWRAVSTAALGRPEDGLANALRAVELDPLNPRRRLILAQQYYWLRQFDRTITVLRSPLLEGAGDAQSMMAYPLLLLGRSDEARAAVDRGASLASAPAVQAQIDQAAIYARSGKPDEGRAILAKLMERRRSGEDVPAGAMAWILAALGEFETASDWYVRAHEEGSIVGVPDLGGDPFLDPFRRSPRYGPLLKLFGLVPTPVDGTGIGPTVEPAPKP